MKNNTNDTTPDNTTTDRDLLLYLVSKIAKIDATVSTLLMYRMTDSKMFEDFAENLIFDQNAHLSGELSHLEIQFPESFHVIVELMNLSNEEICKQAFKKS